MSTELDRALGQLHRRILGAMGLTPMIVGLSLAGCATEPTRISEPFQSWEPEPVDGDTYGGEDRGTRQVAGIPTRPPVTSAPPEQVVYEPVPEVLGAFVPGHVVEVVVRDVPPDSGVAVFVGAPGAPGVPDEDGLALAGAVLMGEAFADSDGVATLRFLVPTDAPLGPARVQAVADDGELRHVSVTADVEVVAVVPTFPILTELHPLVDDANLVVGDRHRACIPESEYGVCPTIAEFHPWQALEITAYALDRPLPAELSARACVPETAFVDDCCYMVELWDALNGSALDACIPPQQNPPDGGGGGGGAGWGGGWAGRPFAVGADGPRVAEVRPADGWCAPMTVPATPEDPRIRERVLQAWIKSAQAEHASVGSFGRFVLELLSLGAPAELVARGTRAQADEIRHAREAFGVASALNGAPVAPGPLRIDGSLDRSTLEVLVSAVLEGCINETISAVQVQEAARRAADPALARLLAATAEDELRHAELSWAFVRWMLDQHPELADAARHAFATFDPGPVPAADPDADALAAWGVLSDRDMHAIAVDVVARVVVPSARSLLGAVSRAPQPDLSCC